MFRGSWQPRRAWRDWPLCYDTPDALARWMVQLVDVRPGMRVLEPSAGTGALATSIRAAVPSAWLEVLEIQPALCDELRRKGYQLVGTDLLAYRPGPIYDRIVMNLPFTGLADIWHILYCYDLLVPGGRLATIASAESTTGTSARAHAFQAWLRDVQAWVHP